AAGIVAIGALTILSDPFAELPGAPRTHPEEPRHAGGQRSVHVAPLIVEELGEPVRVEALTSSMARQDGEDDWRHHLHHGARARLAESRGGGEARQHVAEIGAEDVPED